MCAAALVFAVESTHWKIRATGATAPPGGRGASLLDGRPLPWGCVRWYQGICWCCPPGCGWIFAPRHSRECESAKARDRQGCSVRITNVCMWDKIKQSEATVCHWLQLFFFLKTIFFFAAALTVRQINIDIVTQMVPKQYRCLKQRHWGIFTLCMCKCGMEYGEIKLRAKWCRINVCGLCGSTLEASQLQENNVVTLPLGKWRNELWSEGFKIPTRTSRLHIYSCTVWDCTLEHLAGLPHSTSLFEAHKSHRWTKKKGAIKA